MCQVTVVDCRTYKTHRSRSVDFCFLKTVWRWVAVLVGTLAMRLVSCYQLHSPHLILLLRPSPCSVCWSEAHTVRSMLFAWFVCKKWSKSWLVCKSTGLARNSLALEQWLLHLSSQNFNYPVFITEGITSLFRQDREGMGIFRSLFVFKTGSHYVALADLHLASLCLSSAGRKCVCHHAKLAWVSLKNLTTLVRMDLES